MMTFEEFFLKKKIDLSLFKDGNPDLLSEFKSHFEQMSDKSFDHTKKYWFNNLRKDFPLSEEIEQQLKAEVLKQKAVELDVANEKPLVKIDTVIEKAEEDKPVAKPAGFKPRFKAGVTSPQLDNEAITSDNEKLIEQPSEDKPIAKPAGFKPRFKAGVTAPQLDNEATILNSDKLVEQPSEDKPIAKPAEFKPRFKAGVTAPKIDNEAIISGSEELKEKPSEDKPIAKPTEFKPRFKAGQTSVKKEEE